MLQVKINLQATGDTSGQWMLQLVKSHRERLDPQSDVDADLFLCPPDSALE